jgi:hypothetical protein
MLLMERSSAVQDCPTTISFSQIWWSSSKSCRRARRRIDHGRKLSGYFSLASVEHYLILDPERRAAIHHKRGRGDAIETRVLTNGVARLDPPGFEVAVEALFPPLEG